MAAGTSFGPYINFRDPDSKFGFQSTTWTNCILDLQYRHRSRKSGGEKSPGLYITAPPGFYTPSGDSASSSSGRSIFNDWD